MPSTYYIGTSPEESLGDSPRYFYGLRRNDQGELFFIRSDQLADIDDVTINQPGSLADTFQDFEAGVDYLDGIDAEHEILYENMKYPQYKWDNRSLFFYVDSQGQLVIRINRGYTYPVGISAEG
jgi:cytochrome oxidase Cu insertion factor (SCO1/SenC/PrrC family)